MKQANPNKAQSWDRVWSESAGDLFERSIWDVIDDSKFRYLSRTIPHSGAALEVGCGTARLLYWLANRGWWVVGLDFSSRALEAARRRFAEDGSAIDLAAGDAGHLPFKDDSFDLIGSTGLLEHFADPKPVVAEMVRVLRPAGILYADIVPKKFSLFRSLERLRLGPGPTEPIYERRFKRPEILALFAETGGLENLSVFSAGILPPHKLFSKRLPPVSRLEYPVAKAFSSLSSRLDGTWFADRLGFYYHVTATKIKQIKS